MQYLMMLVVLRGRTGTMSVSCRNVRKLWLCQLSELAFPKDHRRCTRATPSIRQNAQTVSYREVTSLQRGAALPLRVPFRMYLRRLRADSMGVASGFAWARMFAGDAMKASLQH
jgi:hypothetical protein